MSRSKSLALLSVGFLTGYIFTKSVKWLLFILWTIGIFLAGLLLPELAQYIEIKL